jgi:DNA-binding Lrp family transcriptional regulator
MATWRDLAYEDKVRIIGRFEVLGQDLATISRDYNLNAESLGRTLRRLRQSGTLDKLLLDVPEDLGEHVSALIEWKQRPRDDVTWEELAEHAERGAELQNRMRPVITEAHRMIGETEPVLVCFIADFHLGSPHADYRAFLQTTKLIRGDPRFYVCVVGPDQETAFAWFRSADPVLNQTIAPYQQIELYRMWLDEMLDRTIAVCGDNHSDRRLEQNLGDIGLVWRKEVPYFRQWGILHLRVGITRYKIVMSHRWRGRSIYHQLQPALRLMRDVDPTGDVYVTAHTHRPAYMCGVWFQAIRKDRPRQHLVVCGTFKTGNEVFSLGYGGGGVLGVPTLALWPDEYRIACFDNPGTAIAAMGGS